jgi:hypothetical protein
MIKVDKDAIYRAIRVRSGSSAHGDWELVVIADENNEKRTTTIFAANMPSGVVENQQFKIKDITSVKIGWKKDQNGQWKPDTTVTAVLEPIASDIDFADLGGDAGGDLPWEDGGSWDQLPL